jgi:hypothetical protein
MIAMLMAGLLLPSPAQRGEGRFALRQQCEPGWGCFDISVPIAPHPQPLPAARKSSRGEGR